MEQRERLQAEVDQLMAENIAQNNGEASPIYGEAHIRENEFEELSGLDNASRKMTTEVSQKEGTVKTNTNQQASKRLNSQESAGKPFQKSYSNVGK